MSTLVNGLTKHAATIGSVTVAGKSYTAASAIALVQTSITASQNAIVQHSALEDALKTEQTTRASNQPFVQGLKQTLQVMFAGQIATPGDLGLSDRRTPVVSPATRVAAAAKAKATRAADAAEKAAKLAQPAAAPAVAPAAKA